MLIKRLRILLQHVVVTVLCLGIVLLSPGAQPFVIAQLQPQDYEQVVPRVEAFMAQIERLREGIDKTQFDVEALSFELAFEEAEAIIAWVQDHIAFEQYPGLLRGPQGTLMSRAGNALDQAVLLAKLLKDAGYEANVARGVLDEAAAGFLLEQMKRPAKAMPPVLNEGFRDEFISISEGLGVESVEAETFLDTMLASEGSAELFNQAQRDAEVLLGVFASEGLEFEGSLSDYIEEAKDYYWVNYRLSDAEPWQEAHPSVLAEEQDRLKTSMTESFENAIPEALQHRLRFEVVIEAKQGDEVATKAVIEPWERPAANLHGVPLSYTNFADGFLPLEEVIEQGLSVSEGLAKTDFFLPYFNGALAKGAQAFDVNGFVLDPFVASSPAASLFQTQAEVVGGAIGALGSLGNDTEEQEEAFSLTAQWLRYTLIAPDGQETQYERAVFDRIGPKRAQGIMTVNQTQEDPLEIQKALTSTYTFMLATGRYAPGYILDQNLERMTNLLPLIKANLKGDYQAGALKDVDTTWLGHLKLYGIFDDGAFGSLNYRSEPSLAVYKQSLFKEDLVAYELDVVNNTRRAFEVLDGQLVFSPEALVRTGVWETFVEPFVLPRQEADGQEANAASAAFLLEKAKEQAIPLELIKPGDLASLDSLGLNETSKQSIRQDLEQGYFVVLPSTMPDNMAYDLAAWWRIQPQTGETLGMLETGIGGFKEYLVLLATIVGGLGTGYLTFSSCIGSFATSEAVAETSAVKALGCGLCALVAGALAMIFIYAAGSAIASSYGTVGGVTMRTRLGPTVLEAAAVTAIGEWLVAQLCNALGASDL